MAPKVKGKGGKPIGRYFVPHVKVLSQTDTATVFRTVGVPFGGPEWLGGKDLHGEFFDNRTNLGKDAAGIVAVDRIYAYYSHALNDAVGKDLIGYAKFYQETDAGQIWDIEVQRAYRYHDMLLSMAQKDLLGASSQPVQTSVDIDFDSGWIKQWHPAEISLTPQPANPNALATLKEFNIDIKEYEMKADGEEPEAAPEPDPVDPAADATDPDGTTDPAAEPTLEDEIEEIFDEANGEGEAEPEEGEAELEPVKSFTMEELMGLIVTAMEPIIIKAVNDSLTPTYATLDTKMTALGTEMINLKTGVRTFAVKVAAGLALKVNEFNQTDPRSSDEQEADGLRKTSPIPAHAPGMNHRKQGATPNG